MTELEKDLYIAFLETYVREVELELHLTKANAEFLRAIHNHHVEKNKIQPPVVIPPTIPNHWAKSCKACGLRLDGPMGYVCPNTQCPSGLGNVFVD